MNLQAVFVTNQEFSGDITIPKKWFGTTGILDIPSLHLSFKIFKNANQDDMLTLNCEGNIFLEDARTLASVPYPISIQIEEKIADDNDICGKFLEKSKNTLDIMAILWENIVLEIPISFTVSDSLEIDEKNGWGLAGEQEEIDPRLAPLKELLDKEKE